ncbi:MAG: zf-HC2 domain-containing protein [Chloroflexota bacterium]
MPNQPTCEEIYSLVIPYMLDVLGAEGDAPIDAHLASCESCAQYFDQIHAEYCASVQNMFYAYTDRELSTEDRAYVETHLRACGRCRDMFDFDGAVLHHVQFRLREPRTTMSAEALIARFRHISLGGAGAQ